jgi:DNA-directed RNA polymerase subunit M/transcription elongation factor TFIIS
MKHKKKDGKYECLVCSKLYSRSERLKRHYMKDHGEEELKEKMIDAKSLKITRKSRVVCKPLL